MSSETTANSNDPCTACLKSQTPIYAILGKDETLKQVFTKRIIAQSVFEDLFSGSDCTLVMSVSPVFWKPIKK